jgi:hypothetical protein
MRLAACVALSAVVAIPTAEAQAANPSKYKIVWDDFKDGFDASGGPDARWFYFAAPPFVGDDGIETTSNKGLKVVPTGTNPHTGKPAFVSTVAQEEENGGLPGGLDHVKWLVYMNHTASSGYPGFDAQDNRDLSCEAWVKGRTYGTQQNPFGVCDPTDDPRLAAVGMNTIDFESFMVFDFFITNETVYALYERLPFGRPALGNYAAFTFMIPVAPAHPDHENHLRVTYNKSEGTVRWFVDDDEVFSVDQIGYHIDRDYMTIDHGGVEELVVPNQIDCGMGLFTLLDGHLPSEEGLVRLSSAPDFYFHPEVGEPTPQTFIDDESLEESRIWGQGAKIEVKKYVVSSKKSH